jgi:hypothetical protein
VKLPARSPNLNAYAERFVVSVQSECLAKIIPLSERPLRRAVKEYTEHSALEHYHPERNHPGLDNELIEQSVDRPGTNGAAECRERLGGILNYYHRRAAGWWAEFPHMTGPRKTGVNAKCGATTLNARHANPSRSKWYAGQDSNLRPSGSKLDSKHRKKRGK